MLLVDVDRGKRDAAALAEALQGSKRSEASGGKASGTSRLVSEEDEEYQEGDTDRLG